MIHGSTEVVELALSLPVGSFDPHGAFSVWVAVLKFSLNHNDGVTCELGALALACRFALFIKAARDS